MKVDSSVAQAYTRALLLNGAQSKIGGLLANTGHQCPNFLLHATQQKGMLMLIMSILYARAFQNVPQMKEF